MKILKIIGLGLSVGILWIFIIAVLCCAWLMSILLGTLVASFFDLTLCQHIWVVELVSTFTMAILIYFSLIRKSLNNIQSN